MRAAPIVFVLAALTVAGALTLLADSVRLYRQARAEADYWSRITGPAPPAFDWARDEERPRVPPGQQELPL